MAATSGTSGTSSRVAPIGRGRLWYDHEIPDAFLSGLPGIGDKLRWVRSHLPRASRIKVGRASCWYEADIRDFLESQRGQVA